MAFDTVSQTIDLGVSPAELERVLRAYVEDIYPRVVETIPGRAELVGETGQLRPYGVITGMVFAMATRASYGAPLNWFQPFRLVERVPYAPGVPSERPR